jgi:hypothetical protein
VSDTEIPDDVKQQAQEAAQGMSGALNAPTELEPVQQAVPDAPQDMSSVPDPYDVAGQEDYRTDQRLEAVAANAAAPDQQVPEAGGSIDDLSQADYDAMLSAGATLQDSITAEEMNADTSVSEETVNTPVGDLSQSDYDAALSAGQTINDSMDVQAVQTSDPEAAPEAAAPDPDSSLDLTPTVETPEPSGPEPE